MRDYLPIIAMAAAMAAVASGVASCSPSEESFDRTRVVTNPIDLNYAFSGHTADAREAADPVVSIYKDRYYLFPSMSHGYWSSDDMQHWKYIPVTVLPIGLYAPTSFVLNDELYWMTSDINELYKTTDPEDGDSWQLVTNQLNPYPDDPERTVHDPDILLDDDGMAYLYWGCSDVDDIMGIELDPGNAFRSVGEPVALIGHNEDKYGWECKGDNNEIEKPGSNEGASILKLDGKYYLQYASPGTEFESYGDGLFVGDGPLGPYTHADYSPMSVKPGGWMTGAGHGDTFQDKYGNWWHVASTVISQRMLFERRIGFYPVVVTPKGNMYALSEFSDYPYILPDRKVDFSKESPWTGWMDLTSGKAVSVSSSLEEHEACNASDNTIKTWWSAKTGDPGEWISIDLGSECRVDAVQTNFADQDFGRYEADAPKSPYRYIIEVSKDGKNWKTVADKSQNDNDNPHALIVLEQSVKARYVRMTSKGQLTGKFSVYDMRVFGNALGKAPEKVGAPTVVREEDQRRMQISWPAAKGADGYILRWGTDPDELYLTCQTSAPEAELGLFTIGVKYYFSVDSFNGSGVTKGTEKTLSE